jgi:hypothetical protein
VAQEAFARGDCACAPTASPSSSSAPTITALPTYAKPCEVCVGDDTITVQVYEETFSCGELRKFGAARFIDPTVCAEAQRIAELGCGCPAVAESAEPPTLAPVASPNAGAVEEVAKTDRSPKSNAPMVSAFTSFMTTTLFVGMSLFFFLNG